MTLQSPTLSPNPDESCRLCPGLHDEHVDGAAECADQIVDSVRGRKTGVKSRERLVLTLGRKLDGTSYAAVWERISITISADAFEAAWFVAAVEFEEVWSVAWEEVEEVVKGADAAAEGSVMTARVESGREVSSRVMVVL